MATNDALGEIGKGERNVVRVTPSGQEIAPTNKAPAEEGPAPSWWTTATFYLVRVIPPTVPQEAPEKAALCCNLPLLPYPLSSTRR